MSLSSSISNVISAMIHHNRYKDNTIILEDNNITLNCLNNYRSKVNRYIYKFLLS